MEKAGCGPLFLLVMSRPEKRTQGDYTPAFKLGVLSAVEKGEMTCKQTQRKFGIRGRSTVPVWLRRYGRR
jgi:transposase